MCMISRDSIAVNLVKIEAISEWKRLKNDGEIHSFLGFIGYGKRFIGGFSFIASSMILLTRKVFHWFG